MSADQDRLALSERLLAEAQRLAKMGNWNFDFRTDQLTWSDALYDVFGADRETFLETHRSFLSLIHPEDRDFAEQTSKKSQQTGEPFHITYRITTPAGENRIIEEFGYSETDADGRVVRLFGTAQDITDRVRIEQRYRSLVENGADAIAIIGVDGRPTYVSPSIRNVLGYDENDALDLNLFEIVHPDDIEGVADRMRVVMANPGVPIKGHTSRVRHKDGSWRWLEATITNLIHDPNIQGIVDNFRDVTDTVVTEQINHLERALMEASIRIDTDLERILTDYLVGIESVLTVGAHVRCSLILGRLGITLNPPVDGLVAFWSQRITDSEGTEVATVCVYQPSVRVPSVFELGLFQRMASLLGVVLESHNRSIAILERNERFEYAMQATSDAIFDWDIPKDVFVWGDGFQRLFFHEIGSKPFRLADWVALMHPAESNAKDDEWNAFMADPGQQRWTNSFRFRRADGTYAYVDETSYLIRDPAGKPLRMIGVLRDVTRTRLDEMRKQVERDVADLFKTETDYKGVLRLVLGHLANLCGSETAEIWLVGERRHQINLLATYAKNDLAGRLHTYMEDMSRFKPGEGLPGTVWVEGKTVTWTDIDTPGAFLRHEAAKSAQLKTAVGIPIFHNETVIGAMILCSAHELAQDDPGIVATGLLSTFLGTEIKRKESEEELRLFFESAPEILAIASPDGRFLKVNPAFCELLGYTSEELTTRPFRDFIHPDDRDSTLTEFDVNIRGERFSNAFLNRYITNSGDVVWISWSASETYGEEGNLFTFGRNVTDMVKLQSIFDNAAQLARIGSWEVDLIKGTLFWSDITREIHEEEPGFVPDLATRTRYYRNDVQEQIGNAIEQAILEKRTWDLEIPITTAKGRELWVRTIGKPEYRDGVCVRIYGSIQDIHARKSAELALQASYQEKTAILESIGDGFFTVDRDFTVTYWNHAAEVLLHTPRDLVLGRNLWERFADAKDLPSYRNYERAMASSETIHFEDYYAPIDRWFEISAYPSDKGLSIFFKDVTDRKTVEERIRESNERFQIVTEATNDAIWDFDVVRNELFWGRGFLTQFGHDPDVDKPTFDRLISLIHPEDRERIVIAVDRYFHDSGLRNWFEEYRFLKGDGTYATVIDRAVFIRSEQGKVVRVVGAMTDITYRREYEESLKQLNRKLEKHARDLEMSNAELEQFAYVASHDLQEPLRMITSFLTQLRKKYNDKLDDKARQYIHYAVDGASRMRQIILDLLDYSRVGRGFHEQETFNLGELVEDYTLLRANLIKETGAAILYGPMPDVTGHKAPIAQVMHNLLDNAIKYAKPDTKPVIRIQATKTDGYWTVMVEDNGIGIESDYWDKVFIIFQRLHDNQSHSGTGMGLAIVKKIVENLGGKIWLESEIGVGSRFYFTLPAA